MSDTVWFRLWPDCNGGDPGTDTIRDALEELEGYRKYTDESNHHFSCDTHRVERFHKEMACTCGHDAWAEKYR